MATPLTNTVVCPSCGFENIEGSDFCENCQSDLRTIDIPITMQPANDSDLTLPLSTARLSRPVTIQAGATVREALAEMQATNSGALVVLEGSEIVGMFTERDVLKKLAGEPGSVERKVSEVMTPDPVVLRETDSMAVALNKMGVGGFRHIPLTRDGELVAVVSVRDVLKWVVGRYLD
jgi:CBS domain-containing protein